MRTKTLADIERLSLKLEEALGDLVDEYDRWRDVPFAFTDEDIEAMESSPKPLRIEVTCGFCGSAFWPLETVYVERLESYNSFDKWCYHRAGYWFGDGGNGRFFPVCSDSCHDSLRRQMDKRIIHTRAEMAKVSRARRLIQECKATIRRVKRERAKGCTTVHTGGG